MDLITDIENIYSNNNDPLNHLSSLLDNNLSFDNVPIAVFGITDEPFFRAKDILLILGYPQDNNFLESFIKDNISDKNKLLLPEIEYKSEERHQNTSSECKKSYRLYKEIYINEPELYKLILKSNKNNAEQFLEYIYNSLTKNRIKISNKRISDIRILIEENKKKSNLNINAINEEISKK